MFLRKDLLGMKDLNKNEILSILDKAQELKPIIDNKCCKKILKNKSIITMFYENSTRTKTSFTMAGKYLGGLVTDLGISTSSVNKGESLIDTGKTLDQMGTDVMIIRHQMTGAPHILARNVKASVINAGDGTNEHPTQSLLDLFTIREYKKSFKGLKIVIAGDIAHSRVARSNAFALSKLGAKVIFVGPKTLLPRSMTCLGVQVSYDVREAIKDADVVMGLRIQLERQKGGLFPDLREYAQIFGINEDILGLAKKDVLLLHPGPVNRGVELTSQVIDGENSVINEQVKNGVAVRMAILELLTANREKVQQCCY